LPKSSVLRSLWHSKANRYQSNLPGAVRVDTLKFIIDCNAGKLVKWLRMLGYDAVFFEGGDDSEMVFAALAQNRIIVTRDTGIIKRRLITSGRVRAVLLTSEIPRVQVNEIFHALDIGGCIAPFTRCMECNSLLEERKKEEIREKIPPYVYKTQDKYMECPDCRRIYWKGTHWQAMINRLNNLISEDVNGSI
jgi:uncharacterized protein